MIDIDQLKKPLNPIGQCFDSVGRAAIQNHEKLPDMKICHAIIISNMPGQEGQKAGHAWIEFTKDGITAAADTTWGVITQADRYRKSLKAENIIEYSHIEFMKLWFKEDFPGPYDPKIKALTDDCNVS